MNKCIAILFGYLLVCSTDTWTAEAPGKPCTAMADSRLREPLTAIAEEYERRTGNRLALTFHTTDALLAESGKKSDAIFCMPAKKGDKTFLDDVPEATTVAWAYPDFIPVRAAALSGHADAAAFVRFAGSPTGHRLWSKSKGGFTIVPDTTAASMEWVAENRVKHTYPLTAQRMLAELGGIRKGLCIDIGCGPGQLDVELARRTDFKIIGLDIDPGAKPIFDKRMAEAGLQERVTFMEGDAQAMPFPDNHADVIISRGTLTFIPDVGKCLKEVNRVLKPTGVAFLGGRYLYTPNHHVISNEKLKAIVREVGIPGARVVEHRGQWVKIVGPEAPKAAQQFQSGPHMLVNRFIADYGITEGRVLLVCGNDGESQQGLQRGFLESTDLAITALYANKEEKQKAEQRIAAAEQSERMTCVSGSLKDLPFDNESFDLIGGAGPMLIFEKDRGKAMFEIHRVLREGGAALIGGRFLHMPALRKVPSETLRQEAAITGIPSIRVIDDIGQWVEILKGVRAETR